MTNISTTIREALLATREDATDANLAGHSDIRFPRRWLDTMLRRLRLWWRRRFLPTENSVLGEWGITSPSARLRRQACWKLGETGDAGAVERLIEYLGDKEKYVRRAACDALCKLGDLGAVGPLIELLGDDDWHVQLAASNALGGLLAVKRLSKRLEASNSNVRRGVCEALGHLGDIQAMEPLIKCLRDSDSGVRCAACEALGQLGDAQTVNPLIKRLGDCNSDVRRAACKALCQLGRGTLAEALHAVIEGRPDAVAELQRLRASESEKVMLRLLTFLGNDWCTARLRVCEALGHLGGIWAVEPLFQCLGDTDASVQEAARDALSKLGVDEVVCVLDPEAKRLGQQFDVGTGRLRVRWESEQGLLGFDVIEIYQATDFDVELFCINVGNNEDPHCRECCTQVKRVIGYGHLSVYIWAMLRDRFPNAELLQKAHEGR